MNRHICAGTLAIAVAISVQPLFAQGFSVAGRLGTLGLGAEGSLALTDNLAARAGANFQPWSPTAEWSDVDFTLDIASPSFLGVLDFHPGGGAFRFTGGAVLFSSDTKLDAELKGSVDIGDETYTPQQIGTLSGEFATSDLAPYVGIGFGRAPGSAGVGFVFDLGVAFQGEPDVNLSATGPLANDPSFQAELAKEEANIEDDAKLFRFYPVIAIGISIGF